MNDVKPLASLSAGLLASKGAARPAMRSQIQLQKRQVIFRRPAAVALQLEDDLGWNDMGHDQPLEIVLGQTPQPAAAVAAASESVTPIPNKRCTKATRKPDNQAASPVPRRKALTLRVDRDRHLQFRLACAARNRSGQFLLTEALDRLLDETPGIRELADQIRQD